jgi:hypothetical protein
MDPSTALLISEVKDALSKYVKTDDERLKLTDPELDARIQTNIAKAAQDRVKNVKYKIKLYVMDGSVLDIRTFEIVESDLLFGTAK